MDYKQIATVLTESFINILATIGVLAFWLMVMGWMGWAILWITRWVVKFIREQYVDTVKEIWNGGKRVKV